MTTNTPFVLVDGSSYLFRAYHALPPLTNSKGDATGAIVGVINMLQKLIDEYRPEHIAVVFDAPGGSFRNQLYEQYKANRPPMADDLRQQIEPLHRIIRAMGLPLLMIPGVEADDVIGTLATQAADLKMETLVSTGDKDLTQLVNEHTTLINTMNGTLMNRETVKEKFGVKPEQIIDFLALVGDVSDNIPGVPKCGPKTAAKWLQQYGDLDEIVAHADEIKGKVGENLRQSLEQLPLSRELTKIRRDLALDQAPTDLKPSAPTLETLRELYTWIESSRLLDTLGEMDEKQEQTAVETAYETILTQADLDRWLDQLQQAEIFALDTETTSLDYMQAEIVGISFSIEPGVAAYLPLAHSYPGAPKQLSRSAVLDRMQQLLEDPGAHKIGQNLKYDMSVLARYGISLRGVAYDTMLESYVFDSTASRHDMDSLSLKYLNHRMIKYEDVAGKGAKQLSFDQITLEQAAPYAAEDADIALRLHRKLWPQLEQAPPLAGLFHELEMPLVPVLSAIERSGVRIDSAMLAQQSLELAAGMHGLEQQAYKVAGAPFNLSSPKQIGEIFFEQLQLPVLTKTPKGAPSTAESVLQELADQGHELPAIILQYRTLAKLKTTYTDKLPLMVNPDTGRVHTSYHQAVAATGRLSSSDPNLQNIPVRSEEGRRIRQAFIPEPGYLMLAADYSQIELRIMAHFSGDEGMLQAFAEGQDIHRATAAEVFGARSLEEVTSDQRRSAKAINFGLIYGMSAFGLAKQLGIERSAAQAYVDRYFERYPGVQDFMARTREEAHDKGYVETLFGRRLYLPEINARSYQRRTAAERTAINAPMQGTASDIIKRAMLTVDNWIGQEKPPVRMIMQVHDELVFEVQEDNIERAGSTIRGCMESAIELKAPLSVDIGIGANWDEAH